ncbi:uncharacterized protein APUU_10967S [Aspergillus puulaauensis]|uniref:Alpha/Beta hydrolase protein n=1 Tax=Aspergillus puulaauensis TaxID=1220207 RepID=A0A7R7XBA0_9EURO|nr:uncharacterized protein APUU_10967S [Aspergillus puulaauensis]BCS18139.1 hypothetical protein APUU_10967S [Aspergillus puulaauensis]
MALQWSTQLLQAVPPSALQWSPCPSDPALDCTTLTVPLEYADPDNGNLAHIPLARFNATVPTSQRKGHLLTNPGGPGSSGIDFLLNGAGEGIFNITGGFYDIVSWDPRGVGSARPLLQCFNTAGEETEASDSVSAAANVEYTQLTNQSYMPEFYSAIQDYDAEVGTLANACAEHNSTALYTSSAAYVARDMAAIADALERKDNATLNYWGFSYGTIFGAEFIQTFPERVGRIVFDGVFDPEANAKTYASQLPNDELFVRDTIDDLVAFCNDAGPDGCALSRPPGSPNSTIDIAERLATLQASLYETPVEVPDGSFSIDVSTFSFFMYSFIKLPTTWPAVASAVSALEAGDAGPLADLLTDGVGSGSVTNHSAPDTGSLAGWPLQCIDNAPTNHTTVSELAKLVRDISLAEKTPWLNADLATLSFCRNFPDKRPRVSNLGAGMLKSGRTNEILTAQVTPVLIVNALHDPSTPVTSAHKLHGWLGSSSRLITRRGPGHTSMSLASLGLVQAIRDYLLDGQLPVTEVHDVSQLVFDSRIDQDTMTPDPVFNGTYTDQEMGLLRSTYEIFLAFLSLP